MTLFTKYLLELAMLYVELAYLSNIHAGLLIIHSLGVSKLSLNISDRLTGFSSRLSGSFHTLV